MTDLYRTLKIRQSTRHLASNVALVNVNWNNYSNIFSSIPNTHKIYAERYGMNHYEFFGESNQFSGREKLIIYDLFRFTNIEWLLFLDSDILINKDAPNILDTYNDPNKIYMFEENINDSEKFSKEIQLIDSKLEDKGLERYFNSGVILVHKTIGDQICNYINEEKFFEGVWFEQAFLNYIISKYEIPVEPLDRKWNWMYNHKDFHKKIFANFIHYTGEIIWTHLQKGISMRSDFYKLYARYNSYNIQP